MEPPRPDVPDPRREPQAGPAAGDLAPPAPAGQDPLRLTAACAAGALALLATGHLYVLALLLLVVCRTRAGAVALLLAATAVLVRWGNASLAAVAGAQAVLGPAVVVGSAAAAMSVLLAAAAVVLVAPDRLTAPAFGLAAATIAAGSTFPHDLGVRVVGIVVMVLAAAAASRLPRSLTAPAAIAAGGLALLLAAVA